jgi:hypothetical protein
MERYPKICKYTSIFRTGVESLNEKDVDFSEQHGGEEIDCECPLFSFQRTEDMKCSMEELVDHFGKFKGYENNTNIVCIEDGNLGLKDFVTGKCITHENCVSNGGKTEDGKCKYTQTNKDDTEFSFLVEKEVTHIEGEIRYPSGGYATFEDAGIVWN